MSKKYVVYCATRNLYNKLPTAINSLLINNPSIDKVFCFIEDDKLNVIDNPKVKCINASNFRLIMDKVNYSKHYTYLAFLRIFLGRIFYKLNKILYLDVDTIVNDSIIDLWDLDISNYSICAVPETGTINTSMDSKINSGVLLLNLEYIRNNNLDIKALYFMWNHLMKYDTDQELISEIFFPTTRLLSYDYNVTGYNLNWVQTTKIRHYMGNIDWRNDNFNDELYLKYKIKELN